jgi:flavodoxin I
MRILIVFGSLLGKTKRLSILAGHILKDNGHDVVVKDVRSTTVQELNSYDLVIMGCSTWDDGQLQFDFRPFHSELLKNKFSGKNFAVFGVGSHKYPHPYYAADILEDAVKTIEGKLLVDTIKLDMDHDDPEDKVDKDIFNWIDNISKSNY